MFAALLRPWNGGGTSTELITWSSNGGEARVAADMSALGTLDPLPSGFAFVENYELGELKIVPDDGGPVRALPLPWGPFASGPWNSTVDAAGRFVMVAGISTSWSGPFDLQVARIDPATGQVDGPVSVLYMDHGQVIGLADPSTTSEVDVAVDLAGRILVLWNGEWSCGTGTIGGRWFGPDLAPLGPPFVAGSATLGWPFGELEPLLDGSIVLRTSMPGTYTRRFEGGISAGGPVPTWLAEPELGDVVTLPGGRGYARVPFSKIEVSPGTCIAGLEVFAPDGSRCGTIRLGPPEPCERWPPMLGAVTGNGTVVRRLADCPWTGGTTCCRYAWWPNLLPP